MRKGETITEDDIMLKRPGTGIEPQYLNIIIGRKVNLDLQRDTVLTWEMV